MTDTPKPGIYLCIDFDWPDDVTQEQAGKAYKLHTLTKDNTWIREVVAGSGGLGGTQGSTWIFWLENYAALDRLLRDKNDEISQTYTSFFSEMKNVTDKIREEVVFI